ncbi:MAG: hypothetical protein K2J83_06470 [Clostridia bacterium]|nr:hypothetical protein [Clostridia bacterium]
MASHKGKGYLGINNWFLTIIFAIIPVTSWLLGAITRIMRGHIIAGVLQLIIPPVILFFWITDIIGAFMKKDLWLFA